MLVSQHLVCPRWTRTEHCSCNAPLKQTKLKIKVILQYLKIYHTIYISRPYNLYMNFINYTSSAGGRAMTLSRKLAVVHKQLSGSTVVYLRSCCHCHNSTGLHLRQRLHVWIPQPDDKIQLSRLQPRGEGDSWLLWVWLLTQTSPSLTNNREISLPIACFHFRVVYWVNMQMSGLLVEGQIQYGSKTLSQEIFSCSVTLFHGS